MGQTFTREIVEAMCAVHKQPIIMALSNPTSQAECTAEQVCVCMILYSLSLGHQLVSRSCIVC